MRIDLPTLYLLAMLTSVFNGLMLLFSWLQNRAATTLAWWGGAILVLVCGGILVALRGVVPDPLSIVVGNGLWLASYGMMWCAARVFEGRRPRLLEAAAGAIVWAFLCQNEIFYGSQVLRICVFSAIISVYSLLIPAEYWHSQDPQPASRWIAIALSLLQALFYALRIPFAEQFVFPVPPDDVNMFVPVWVTALCLHIAGMSFLAMVMVKERLELQLRRTTLIDPLTGIANRRAFFDRGGRTLSRLSIDRAPAALLMIDLDFFKRINDTYGHDAGDRVLCAFGTCTTALLRPSDLFARTGGEEFACLLPNTDMTDALETAERIRRRFASQTDATEFSRNGPTVSVGVATTTSCGYQLDTLMAAADRALYAAKANGRNRVEGSLDDRQSVAPPIAPSQEDASGLQRAAGIAAQSS
ncbi:GGDEF domain-containing protein [Xanthobacteraceae bacterium Astr-EGSB]|uniref:GGDEF domain-containing protein n=1 Tax=Astrobacterium formosum TaxID=3069710 RepID=UPI0027B01AB4|nr:GGDEF domain-containing protein [Xanthobacteraceae bacterium Astr-EGSB]